MQEAEAEKGRDKNSMGVEFHELPWQADQNLWEEWTHMMMLQDGQLGCRVAEEMVHIEKSRLVPSVRPQRSGLLEPCPQFSSRRQLNSRFYRHCWQAERMPQKVLGQGIFNVFLSQFCA